MTVRIFNSDHKMERKMSHKKINAISLVCALLLGLYSLNANAFSVWAVEGGALSTSNSAGNELVLSPGVNSIDLYFDTEGDISWGWDIILEVIGTGTVTNPSGGDINGGLSTPLASGGLRQLGGNPGVDLNSSSILMFSFDFDAIAGTVLSIGPGSTYFSGTLFDNVAITLGDLVTIEAATPVPLPAAAWLLFSGIGFLGFAAKRKAATA
jgi:hypothetical protein